MNKVKQNGYTLMVSLVFMIILTIIATMSTDSTTFEMRMSMNAQLKAQSLECSERLRNSVADMLESLEIAQGWADSNGGSTSDIEYKGVLDRQIKVLQAGDSAEHLITNINATDSDGSSSLCRSSISRNDNETDNADDESEESMLCDEFVTDVALVNDSNKVLATLSIYRMSETLLPGFGAGQNMDYRGPGSGMSAATAVYYHLRSVSEDACLEIDGAKTHARTITESEYRLIPI